jgi:hypothetical protein
MRGDTSCNNINPPVFIVPPIQKMPPPYKNATPIQKNVKMNKVLQQ